MTQGEGPNLSADATPDEELELLEELSRPRARRASTALIALASLVLGAWLLSQGMRADSTARALLTALLSRVREPELGVLYVLAAYGLGTLVFAPVTVLFVATALAVGPWLGAAYCMLGGLFSASLARAAGRLLEARLLRRLPSRHLAFLQGQVQQRPLRSVLIARFLPVGNFTLINLFLGGLGSPYGKFLLGNVVGMLPAVLGITAGKELLWRAIESPDTTHFIYVGLGGAVLAGLLFAISRMALAQTWLSEEKRTRNRK